MKLLFILYKNRQITKTQPPQEMIEDICILTQSRIIESDFTGKKLVKDLAKSVFMSVYGDARSGSGRSAVSAL